MNEYRGSTNSTPLRRAIAASPPPQEVHQHVHIHEAPEQPPLTFTNDGRLRTTGMFGNWSPSWWLFLFSCMFPPLFLVLGVYWLCKLGLKRSVVLVGGIALTIAVLGSAPILLFIAAIIGVLYLTAAVKR